MSEDNTMQIVTESHRRSITERIQDMTYEELVQLGNAITSIKRVSILTGKREKRKSPHST
jgi:hypothetical protein